MKNRDLIIGNLRESIYSLETIIEGLKPPRCLVAPRRLYASINRKMGYPVSALRAIEVVMYLNAPLALMPPLNSRHSHAVFFPAS